MSNTSKKDKNKNKEIKENSLDIPKSESWFEKWYNILWKWGMNQMKHMYYLGCVFWTVAIYWRFWLRFEDCDI